MCGRLRYVGEGRQFTANPATAQDQSVRTIQMEWALEKLEQMRKLCLAYWMALTVALVVRNPLTFFFRGNRGLTGAYAAIEPAVHFLSFAVLAGLCTYTDWPVRRRWLLAAVAVYAVLTEAVQALVPGRTPELADVVQNFAGIAAGTAIGWGILKLREMAALRRAGRLPH